MSLNKTNIKATNYVFHNYLIEHFTFETVELYIEMTVNSLAREYPHLMQSNDNRMVDYWITGLACILMHILNSKSTTTLLTDC